jgi:hypothetical protein
MSDKKPAKKSAAAPAKKKTVVSADGGEKPIQPAPAGAAAEATAALGGKPVAVPTMPIRPVNRTATSGGGVAAPGPLPTRERNALFDAPDSKTTQAQQNIANLRQSFAQAFQGMLGVVNTATMVMPLLEADAGKEAAKALGFDLEKAAAVVAEAAAFVDKHKPPVQGASASGPEKKAG